MYTYIYIYNIEILKDKYNNNLTSKERQALYDLKNDKNIKGTDKGSAVVVWDREVWDREIT